MDAARSKGREPEPCPGGRQVVVAGSDELARRPLAARLRCAGHDVLERATGDQAARVVLENPDCTTVILVGALPDGTPGAFASWLRQSPSTCCVPLVAIVPRDGAELAADARAGGADAVLSMPVDFDEVLYRVELVLPAVAFAA